MTGCMPITSIPLHELKYIEAARAGFAHFFIFIDFSM